MDDPEGETRASKRARKTSSRLTSLGADDEGARFATRRIANKRSASLRLDKASEGRLHAALSDIRPRIEAAMLADA